MDEQAIEASREPPDDDIPHDDDIVVRLRSWADRDSPFSPLVQDIGIAADEIDQLRAGAITAGMERVERKLDALLAKLSN